MYVLHEMGPHFVKTITLTTIQCTFFTKLGMISRKPYTHRNSAYGFHRKLLIGYRFPVMNYNESRQNGEPKSERG